MVPPPRTNSSSFFIQSGAGDSSINSEDQSDYDNEGSASVDSINHKKRPAATLTNVHLRKAKLMFFYTRYPSSAVLKSYFPDVHFDKNNTAQLVKWFSNFREFFYMQMEKYAKQAISEGVRHRDEIQVTTDSEIYKTLNTHYNRNNVIAPPERLRLVIEETLKEFYVALKLNKDSEPSWKKVIYKVIQQLDEPIPEEFKYPQFTERLEQQA